MPTKTAETATQVAPRKKSAAPPALFTEPATVIVGEVMPKENKPVRLVNGQRVIAEEAVDSPLPTRDKNGKPITFKTFMLLTLEDGSKVFACKDCTYTCEQRGVIITHRQHEHPRPNNKMERRRKAATATPEGCTALDVPTEVLNKTLFDVIEEVILFQQIGETAVALQGEVERLTAELAASNGLLAEAERRAEKNQGYREKALASENELRRIYAALAKVGFVLKVEDDE